MKEIVLNMRIKRYLSVLLGALFCVTSHAHEDGKSNLAFSAQGWYGHDMEQTRPGLQSYGYMTYEAGLGFQTEPSSGCAYAEAFGFPMFTVGFSLARTSSFTFSDQTKFPDLYSVYGSFERSLYRAERFSVGYMLDFGATYNPGRYNPVDNPGNNWLSSPFMAYFGAGAFAKLHLGKRWEIGADVMFRHFSNGRLALPNEALNALGVGIFTRYRMSDYNYAEYKSTSRGRADFEKKMQYMLVFGGGVHTCMAEWNAYVESEPDPEKKMEALSGLKKHPKLSLSFDAIYRYSMRYATGVGVDLFYSSP